MALFALLLMSLSATLGVDFGRDFTPSQQDNMNGDYVFSSTPGGTPGLFPKQYKDYPGGVESFDVYSPPMSTFYSQVWWSPLPPTELPSDIVSKYAGKGMAIVGWEIDQVRRTPEGDVSVPISASYNHHYVAQMIGAKAKFNKVTLDGPDDPRAAAVKAQSGHGMIAYDQPHYVAEEVQRSSLPTSQQFSSANGGEYRKTYHGFTPGYALVLDSPTAMQISPMQIDTWNRDAMNISSSTPPRFVPGPLPRSSLAPPDAEYSGLLECPMTTRITKQIDGDYLAKTAGTCDAPILTFQECYHAAASTLRAAGQHTFSNHTGSDPTLPPGCSASLDSTNPFLVHVFFNTHPAPIVACAAGATALTGTTSSLVTLTVTLDQPTEAVTITLKGPTDAWFGVGFGATAMADLPWALVVEGDGTVSEHKLGNQAAGTVLAPSVTVVSNAAQSGLRTVVLTRPMQGATSDYFTFNTSTGTAAIPVINAIGSSVNFAYHKAKAPTTITLLPAGQTPGACICPEKPQPFGQATGTLVYNAVANQSADTGAGAVGFSKSKCAPWPATVLIEQGNPTCDIRHYRGGQWSCHHMWSLLDADQEIPWVDQPLVFHHKYRFHVQPYNQSYHTPLVLGEKVGSALLIGAAWEYDVPKCSAGVPGCSLVGDTWIHTIMGSTIGKHNFSALNFHCHAPTCLSMSVYACPKGTALGDCNQTLGQLICQQRPVYGGTGHPALNGTRFDEPGYIAIPDCFWGGAEFGLEAPPDLTGVPLHMVKTCNATWAHYGEMAGGQPWVFG